MLLTGTDCPKCGGMLTDKVDEAEKLRCIYCGWRSYADKFSSPNEKGESFHLKLPYVGGNEYGQRQRRMLVAQITGGNSAYLTLRVLCPFCNLERLEMDSLKARQRWVCAKGHFITLERKGREFTGWY